jgi:flagellar biosynthetic protein FlhB
MADDLGERTEEATPKRRQEAREEGNVAKSTDLAAAGLLIVASFALAGAVKWMLEEAALVMGAVLDGSMIANPLDPSGAWTTVKFIGTAALRISAPVLLLAWLGGFLGNFAQIGWLIAPKGLAPKANRLSPISGFKRLFGVTSLVKGSLDALKVAVVVAVAVWTVSRKADEILMLPYLPMLEGLATIGVMMLELALKCLAVLLLLGVIDFAFQKSKHSKDLRMTKQQVKDEMKQTEGDPEVKRRRMRIQQQIAMQRITAAVPKADVIVTNPEHFAVAIQYDPDRMRAPQVVAKGADHLAFRIRQLAMKHGVPIVERKPLARALYRNVEVGQEVPPEFYNAVAEVLAYVYRLSGKMAS